MPRAVPSLFVLVGLAAPAVLYAQSVQGTRYTFRMTAGDSDRVTGVVREANGRARIDFPDRSGHDAFILVLDGGRRMVNVRPDEREYEVLDDTTFERVVATALQKVSAIGLVSFRVRDLQVSGERLGPGETMLSRPTTRSRLRQHFTVEVRAMGVAAEAVTQDVTTDYWVSHDLHLVPNPLLRMLAGLETVLAQSDPEFVRRSEAARRNLIDGTALRVVVTSRASDEGGRASVRTITITAIEAATLDAGLWDIPAGYTRSEAATSIEF